MKIELWQVPLLVIAIVVVLDFTARAVAKRRRLPTERRKQLKAAGLGLLAVVGALLLWVAWPLYGTSAAASIAAVVQTLIEATTLWLTYQAYKEAKAARAQSSAQASGEAAVPEPDSGQVSR